METNYMNSCGCNQQPVNRRMMDCSAPQKNMDVCPVTARSKQAVSQNVSDKIDALPLGMAYVPMQHYDQMFPLCRGLKEGTIFPELCLPFCGKRRNCSC